MLSKVEIFPQTAASRLPTKSWVFLVIRGYLTIVECIQMQAVNRDFYYFVAPKRLC